MVTRDHVHLTRRERQIMDVLYSANEATAQQIHEQLPDAPSYSAVRALLKKLLDKGHVVFSRDGARYVYRPVLAKKSAQQGAIRRLLDTFFGGSSKAAVVNLLGTRPLSADDLEEIEAELARLKRDAAKDRRD